MDEWMRTGWAAFGRPGKLAPHPPVVQLVGGPHDGAWVPRGGVEVRLPHTLERAMPYSTSPSPVGPAFAIARYRMRLRRPHVMATPLELYVSDDVSDDARAAIGAP